MTTYQQTRREMIEPEQKSRVLVVEDHEMMRSVLCRSIRSEGYVVLQAADGQDALSLLAEPGSVDLVVADVCMPKMDGRELGLVLADRHPEIPLLFISAYAESVVPANLPGPLLRKPFRPTELITEVRQLLGETDSPRAAAAPILPSTWKPPEDIDRAVRAWMKGRDWEVSRTNYDTEQEVYAWRHDVRGGPSPTLTISRNVLESYPAFVLLYHLDQLKVANIMRAQPEARLVVVQKGSAVVLYEES
jgi:CheY-like chemotaxis protein